MRKKYKQTRNHQLSTWPSPYLMWYELPTVLLGSNIRLNLKSADKQPNICANIIIINGRVDQQKSRWKQCRRPALVFDPHRRPTVKLDTSDNYFYMCRPSPIFKILQDQTNYQVETMLATGYNCVSSRGDH